MSGENEALKQIKEYIKEMLKITRDFLGQISDACKPHTLAELIGEIMPRMAYVIGGPKEWYELIEEGRGLHGEQLQLLSIDKCRLLNETLWKLTKEMNAFFDEIGVGSMIRRVDATFSSTDRTRLKLEKEMVEHLDHIERLTQDILAQTQGYTDRTKQSGAIEPLSYQIRSTYELENKLSELDTSLDKYRSFGIQKPTLLIQRGTAIEKLEKIRIRSVTAYIQKAESALQNNDFQIACHEARNALEESAASLANLITDKAVKRTFKDAVDIFRTRNLLPEDTVTTLLAKHVGVYGWLSIKGGHAEGVSAGVPAKHFSEARYAINWAYSAIILLIDAYLDYIGKRM